MSDTDRLRRRVRVARGEEPGDLLLTGGRVVQVLSEEIVPAAVVVADGVIAGVGSWDWEAAERIELDGALLAPGLIDAHIHVESTLLVPWELARVIVPRGTTAIVADPHEIANVLGIPGVEAMLAASEGLSLDCFFTAPSCVPASPFEASGAVLGAEDVERLLAHERVIGLAEMMNFPGVLAGDAGCLAKIAAAVRRGAAVDGHAPGVVGRELVAYAAAGIESDHECTTIEEALERDALGMLVQVREGTMARNLDALLPAIVDGRLRHWCLCTDDVLPEDLLRDGHLDGLLRRLVAAGVPAATAIRHASFVPARHYGRAHPGLARRGAVLPGRIADLVAFADAESFRAALVVKGGRVVARDGAMATSGSAPPVPTGNTIRIGRIRAADFEPAIGPDPQSVVGLVPDQIVTRHERRSVPTSEGRFAWRAEEDVAILACAHRHADDGRVGAGLVAGFGFRRRGAIASSVGHDAHNIVAAGTHPEELHCAVEALARIGGGFACVADGAVAATMPLPVAGLLSVEPAEGVVVAQRAVDEAARALGCVQRSPLGTLSFLALTVIPSLRITDRGIFDVERFALVER